MPRKSSSGLLLALLLSATATSARAGEVFGRVEMPSTCSPTSSPAVVTLESLDGKPVAIPSSATPPAVALVHQQGLQFEPRVQAVTIGQTIRFTNEDTEAHNVHILTPGVPFNRLMSPGHPEELKVEKAGVIRLVCDIHSHMRGYVVVSPTPWASVVRNGKFRLDDVTPGRYKLVAWHEMGEGLTREITVGEGRTDVGTLTLPGFDQPVASAAVATAVVRTWPEVIERISVKLADSRSAATVAGGATKARKLAEDAYWDEFESSDMETAVRSQLGFQRAGELEGYFRDFRKAIGELSKGTSGQEVVVARSRQLLTALNEASNELNAAGITDRTRLGQASAAVDGGALRTDELPAKKRALAETFDRIQQLADADDPAEAASTMTSAYFDSFEPLERVLLSRRPQDVRPLEVRFNALRGQIGSGLKGVELAAALDGLRGDVTMSVDKAVAASGGSFLPAFIASLVTILREGVEIILILTMLITLVVKTGRRSALSAIWWGVGLAGVASILTAVGLNLLVSSAQGRAREMLEGWVLLAAAGVLFYVSYWLISQTVAKRWTDFLKRHAAEGAQAGAFSTLGLTAFLAVFREGAETALMYQAMIAGHGGETRGMAGLAAGFGVGLILLSVFYRVLRKTSVRLPLGTFFKVTGAVLFAMAVIFAGNGVFELQQAGVLKVTEVRWMQGFGISWLGIYPNVQALAVQGLLLGGAALALILPMLDQRTAAQAAARTVTQRGEPVQAGA